MSTTVAAQITEAMDAQTAAFQADVVAGLSAPRKTLPSRWLYDDTGSELFEQITTLPEYYPTRTERALLEDNAAALAEYCGPDAVLIEYGAGASVKSEVLLAALRQPRMYVPIDIAGDFLAISATRLRTRFEQLEVLPFAADFTASFELPSAVPTDAPRTGLFLGSTIGNLDRDEARDFLNRVYRHVTAASGDQPGRALIGIDLKKSTDILIPAYDDAAGITGRFNLNLLERINRELDGTFNIDKFRHEARWNDDESAIEMHIVSLVQQTAGAGGHQFAFDEGETIHSESSRKYSIAGFDELAKETGWHIAETWTDTDELFALVGLEVGR